MSNNNHVTAQAARKVQCAVEGHDWESPLHPEKLVGRSAWTVSCSRCGNAISSRTEQGLRRGMKEGVKNGN